MLKRLAVLGNDEAFHETVERTAQDTELQIFRMRRGDDVPRAAAALLAPESETEWAVQGALVLAARQEELLFLLGEAIDCREASITGAAHRVVDHASRFSIHLNLTSKEQLTLERAALVRNIGKLRIPNDILLKKDVLSYDEWALIRSFPALGAEFVLTTDCLSDTAEVVRRFHECYDGTGYPDGIEGEFIPYLARALKIVDAYCAMTTPRAYRPAQYTHEDAVAYLEQEKGTHFDPELVDAFVEGQIGAA
jgi:response regulator RpfG family c-di-GMP phosphodiesterase